MKLQWPLASYRIQTMPGFLPPTLPDQAPGRLRNFSFDCAVGSNWKLGGCRGRPGIKRCPPNVLGPESSRCLRTSVFSCLPPPPPPLPFNVQLHVSQHPPYKREGVFVPPQCLNIWLAWNGRGRPPCLLTSVVPRTFPTFPSLLHSGLHLFLAQHL